MLAVTEISGKQYSIRVGDVINVNKVKSIIGQNIILPRVIVLYTKNSVPILGKPLIRFAYVEARVLKQIKDLKILVFKKKRRKNYRRKIGHKQRVTILKIIKIEKK